MNFGVAYTSTQESVRSQGLTITLVQSQCRRCNNMHGDLATATTHHLHGTATVATWPSWIGTAQHSSQRWKSSPDRTISLRPMSDAATHTLQMLRKFEILPYTQRGHQQHPHRCNLPKTGALTQPKCNKDEHHGRIDSKPPQNDSSFSFWPQPACPSSTTCACPHNLAAATSTSTVQTDNHYHVLGPSLVCLSP